MRYNIAAGGLAALFFIAAACTSSTDLRQETLAALQVKWHLVGNNPDETCHARFTFINSSPEVLASQDWVLYFNQNTLHMGSMPDSLSGIVEHVNGDLYRFRPGPSFSVKPGDSIMISYSYRGYLIKESDAPVGAYFVLHPGEKEEAVVRPGSFAVAPFENLEAIFPIPDVLSAVPTPARRYELNQAITALPKEKIGKIIPTPVKSVPKPGKVELNNETSIRFRQGLENEARLLAASLQKLFQLSLNVSEGTAPAGNTIFLTQEPVTVAGVSSEAYTLSISAAGGIRIAGSDAAGVFYGTQSLLSLLWAERDTKGVFAGCVEISDAPRFAYRGFLLDVSRNFQQKKDVLRLVDLLSAYKVNKLNIRITEDEGWRIEIAGLPELTQVASKRGHTQDSKNWLTPSFGSGPDPNSPNNYGNGFYTREDFKEIITYAAQRHVQVIPEVCFPSHARAAIKAMEARYDYYMAKNEPAKANEFRLIDPDDQSHYLSAQMYKDNIVCVALPAAYHFYEVVVKDFMAMYEEAGLRLTTFNTGGDEVPNGAWKKSPLSRELMKQLPDIRDARQLHSYFQEKAMAIFEKYDLQVTGWEEVVLNKDSANNVTVNPKLVGKKILPLVWDNTGENIDLGYRIANAGYNVVLCNVTNLYFDLAYDLDPKEPGLYWGGFQDAIDPYVMAPFDVYKTAHFDRFGRFQPEVDSFEGKQRLASDKRKNIAGLQAQLWSETLKGPAMMEYYVVPKLFAFAEKAWAPAPAWEQEADLARRTAAIQAGWSELANRIGHNELPKMDKMFETYNYRITPPGAIIENGVLKVNVSFPGLVIRYTTDGSDPDVNSPVYTAPVNVAGIVKVRAFAPTGRGGRVFTVMSSAH